MEKSDPTIARASDPLSTISHKSRIGLLISSLVGILFVQAGLVPTKLSVMGVQFEKWDNEGLITINIFVCIYYLLSFSVQSFSDYMIYRMKVFNADTEADKKYEEILQRQADDELTEQDEILLYRFEIHGWIFKASGQTAQLRRFVEFILPIIISLYSIIVMSSFVVKT